jgi:hypothetical protein
MNYTDYLAASASTTYEHTDCVRVVFVTHLCSYGLSRTFEQLMPLHNVLPRNVFGIVNTGAWDFAEYDESML